MRSALSSWQLWALLSAGFAGLTAIFAKIGVENVGADFATFVRTIVILIALGGMLAGTGQWQPFGVGLGSEICLSHSQAWRPELLGSAISGRSNWAMPLVSRRSTN